MGATEPIQGGPYPVPTDAPDGPAQMKGIVDWSAGRGVMRFASAAARDAVLTGANVVNGMVCFIAADNGYYVRVGGRWEVLWRNRTGTLTPVSERVTVAAWVDQTGPHVYLDGNLTFAEPITLANGASYALATVTPPPTRQFYGVVSAAGGPVDMSIAPTTGVLTLRNLSGASKTFTAGHYIGLSSIRYRTTT